jgi:uridine kinase
MLVGISGIDGSGKSTVAARLADRLNSLWMKTVLVQLDDWHNPPAVRFSPTRPAETFYESGLRMDELFSTLVLPLQRDRRVHLQATLARLPEERPFRHTFAFDQVDMVVLEGIFLFKQRFQGHFDFRCWVDCPFQTALVRALRRNQEGLAAERLVRDYQRIYFPAQRVHFAKDRPIDSADFIFCNSTERAAKAALAAGHSTGAASLWGEMR